MTSVILISEYRAYDADKGLEYHVTGTVATRQHIRNALGYLSIELVYNSLFSAKSWQNPTSIDEEERNKKLPQLGLNLGPLDHHPNALLTELSYYLVVCVNY